MDLDDEELKATKELNGVSNAVNDSNEKIIQMQEEANKKIEEAVMAINKSAEELSKVYGIKHVMVIGYADVGVLQGFISSNANLKNMESQTTFLLDFASRNIKEGVRQHAEELKKKLEKEIEKESKDV